MTKALWYIIGLLWMIYFINTYYTWLVKPRPRHRKDKNGSDD